MLIYLLGGNKMTAKMRKVMYLVETPDGNVWPTYSYKAAISEGKIFDMILIPVDGLTDKQREAKRRYREKVWAKFHNKPRA